MEGEECKIMCFRHVIFWPSNVRLFIFVNFLVPTISSYLLFPSLQLCCAHLIPTCMNLGGGCCYHVKVKTNPRFRQRSKILCFHLMNTFLTNAHQTMWVSIRYINKSLHFCQTPTKVFNQKTRI